jgi:hypothetical protein
VVEANETKVNPDNEKAAYKAGYRDGSANCSHTSSVFQTESKQYCPSVSCSQVESELRNCKQQLQGAEFEGERRGFYRGQMQR